MSGVSERPVSARYTGTEYHTAPGDHRRFSAKVLPLRVPFFLSLMGLVRRGGIQARRGLLDEQVFVDRSDELIAIIESCGGRVHVEGLSHLRGDSSPVVVVANHMSLLETFMFPAMILPGKPMAFVVKQSLLDYPYLGEILRVREAIAVGRTNPREDLRTVLSEGQQRLEQGTSVCVFPQSTRSDAFDASLFNSIGVKLAERAGVPVIPAAVKTDFLGNGRWLKDLGPVDPAKELHVCFGPPLAVTRATSRSVHAETVAFIRAQLSSWGVACRD